jgi:signal transduction histidine kinase
VTINLVSNAINNSFKGEIIISLSYNKDKQQIQVTVEDEGIGIPEERQLEIFNIFKNQGPMEDS